MNSYRISPVDTWFLRDGTPFFADDGAHLDVGGRFPPAPPSMVGALRAGLAAVRGWNGVGRWPAEFEEVLGSGPHDLGRIRIQGPFLSAPGGLLLPLPHHFWRESARPGARKRGFRGPGPGVVCDFGDDAALPELAADSESPENLWLSAAAFERALTGRPPADEDITTSDSLWQEEARTGIWRDADTRAVREGMLYSARHFRLEPNTALRLNVSGIPEDWPSIRGAHPFGGESRLAWWESDAEVATVEMPLAQIFDEGRFILVALTPLDLRPEVWSGRECLSQHGDIRVVSACIGRSIHIGGWDSLARTPLPMHSFIPPGSVLFCECREKSALPEVVAEWRNGMALPAVGERTAIGFGTVALGLWRGSKEQE